MTDAERRLRELVEQSPGNAAAERELRIQAVSCLPALLAELDALRATVRGYQTELAEVDQTLGRALGYPTAGPEIGGDHSTVCTGESTPASLAAEAERELDRRRWQLAAARADALREAAAMASSESDQAATGWGCQAHASPGIAAALRSFAVELDELARRVVKTYSIWCGQSDDAEVWTLAVGTGRPAFADGTPDPTATELRAVFGAASLEEAQQRFRQLTGREEPARRAGEGG